MTHDTLYLTEEVEFLPGTEIKLKSYEKSNGWITITPVSGGRYEIPTEKVDGIIKAKKW